MLISRNMAVVIRQDKKEEFRNALRRNAGTKEYWAECERSRHISHEAMNYMRNLVQGK